MNIKKYVFIGICAFLVVVLLFIGLSARFNLSNITTDPYTFIENFFTQWSPALSAAGALIVAILAFWAIYENRRTQEREKEQVIHALYDELYSVLTDVVSLRRRMGPRQSQTAVFQFLDISAFEKMAESGQLHRLENLRVPIIATYKVIKQYNEDATYSPRHGKILEELQLGLEKVIRGLETKFKFLPRYIKEKSETEQAEHLEDKSSEDKRGLLKRKPWILLIPFAIAVVVTVILLITIALLHPLDSEYTLAVRGSYYCHGLAGVLALLAALFSSQRGLVKRILIVAIELYLLGMFFQLVNIIS